MGRIVTDKDPSQVWKDRLLVFCVTHHLLEREKPAVIGAVEKMIVDAQKKQHRLDEVAEAWLRLGDLGRRILQARGSDKEFQALREGCVPILQNAVRNRFLPNGDDFDLGQEAGIGFYNAVRDFDPWVASDFYAFAKTCVTRQVTTAVKTATRQKNLPLNYHVSLSQHVYDDETGATLGDFLVSETSVHTDMTGVDEVLGQLEDVPLTSFERDAFMRYLEGENYKDIARAMNKQAKSVDNALGRAKRKVREAGLNIAKIG